MVYPEWLTPAKHLALFTVLSLEAVSLDLVIQEEFG